MSMNDEVLDMMSGWVAHQMLHVGFPRTHSATEHVSAQIPCNQPHCAWALDTEWQDPAAFPGRASLPTVQIEALLRDHFERQHGIPVIPVRGAAS